VNPNAAPGSYTGAPADALGVFDALLPGWSSPARVAALLLAWLLVDAALVVLAARGGRGTLAAAVLLAGLSAGGVAVVVRGHGGRALGNAALVARLALLVLAGTTAWGGSRRRLAAVGGAVAVTLALALPVVVLLGEATVAP
jgi:hypothetical protein